MKWSKEEARSILLGEQWFQGRTGVNQQTPTKEKEEKKDSEAQSPVIPVHTSEAIWTGQMSWTEVSVYTQVKSCPLIHDSTNK